MRRCLHPEMIITLNGQMKFIFQGKGETELMEVGMRCIEECSLLY